MKSTDFRTSTRRRRWLILAISVGIWSFVALATGISMYMYDRGLGRHVGFAKELTIPIVNCLIYACLTPMIYYVGIRYPAQRANWGRRTALYLAGGFAFTLFHVMARGLAYPVKDPLTGKAAAICLCLFRNMFFYNVVDDVLFVYLPVLTIVHALWYYQEFRNREQRALQLEAQLTQAHLELLKSQLQPHFLFNTLHSISALMHINVLAADRMMTRLSDLLRMSLENGTMQVTTLQRELEFVNGYLEIEKVRFEERLSVVLEVAPETLDAEVPHLLLQPLVENAVRHGVSRRSSQGEIQIAAWHDATSLYLRVRDNGPGLDGRSAAESKIGIGLGAASERLATLYGSDQSLEIRPSPEGGVEVCVKIPFRTEPQSTGEVISEEIEPEALKIL